MSPITLQLSPVSEKEEKERLEWGEGGREGPGVHSDPRENATRLRVRDRAADDSRLFWCTFDRN